MSFSSPPDTEDSDVAKFSSENKEFLSRILAHGDAEARGYALAVLANGGTVEDIELVQNELEKIKRELVE